MFLQEEAHLPRRVSRHQQAPQPPGAQLQKLAVLQAFIVTAGGRSHGAGGVGVVQMAQGQKRKALLQKAPLRHTPEDPAGLRIVQGGTVHAADVDGPRRTRHLRGKTGMIGMQMGEHHVDGLVQAAQGLQPGKQGLPAGALTKAGIHQNAALCAAEQIGVELFQRVAGQGHRDPEEAGQQFFGKGRAAHSVSSSSSRAERTSL